MTTNSNENTKNTTTNEEELSPVIFVSDEYVYKFHDITYNAILNVKQYLSDCADLGPAPLISLGEGNSVQEKDLMLNLSSSARETALKATLGTIVNIAKVNCLSSLNGTEFFKKLTKCDNRFAQAITQGIINDIESNLRCIDSVLLNLSSIVQNSITERTNTDEIKRAIADIVEHYSIQLELNVNNIYRKSISDSVLSYISQFCGLSVEDIIRILPMQVKSSVVNFEVFDELKKSESSSVFSKLYNILINGLCGPSQGTMMDVLRDDFSIILMQYLTTYTSIFDDNWERSNGYMSMNRYLSKYTPDKVEKGTAE